MAHGTATVTAVDMTIAALVGDQAREQRIARAGMMARSELPALSMETQFAVEVLGVYFYDGPGCAAPTVRVAMPVTMKAEPHPLDPTRWWLVDYRGQRLVAVSWIVPPLFSRDAGRGTVAVLPRDGLAYSAHEDPALQRTEVHLRCLRCKSGGAMRLDRWRLADEPRAYERGWRDMEARSAVHVAICRRMRWALQPSQQRPGTPPVLEAEPPAVDGEMLPAKADADTWRLFAPRPKPSGKTNWKAHPPSKRKRMRGWQTVAHNVKAAYEPLRGWLHRHDHGPTPAWARDPRDPWWQPVAEVLRPWPLTVTALGATWHATVWALAEPDAAVRAAVEAGAAVVVCDGLPGGHLWESRRRGSLLPTGGTPLPVTCARCGCDGVEVPGGPVLTGKDAAEAMRYSVAVGAGVARLWA